MCIDPVKGGKMASESTFITTSECAKILGVSIQTIMLQIYSGKLKAVKLGTIYRSRRTDFEAYLDSCVVKPRPIKKRASKPSYTANGKRRGRPPKSQDQEMEQNPEQKPVVIVSDEEEVIPFEEED